MDRIRKTLGNWRWWLALPVVLIVGVPLMLVGLVLSALVVAGQEAERVQRGIPRVTRPLLRWLHAKTYAPLEKQA